MSSFDNLEGTIVVGAGIGGLATAAALRSIAGISDVKIFERTSQEAWASSGSGTGLSIFPNGMAALQIISPELHQAVLDEGTVIKHAVSVGISGIERKKSHNYEEEHGQPMVGIRWCALREILASQLPTTTITFDSQLEGFLQNRQTAQATFIPASAASSTNRELLVAGPMVLCADGVRSSGRHILQLLNYPPAYVPGSPPPEQEAARTADRLREEPADYGRDFIRSVVPSSSGLGSLGGPQATWTGPASSGPAGGSAFAATMPVGRGGTYWMVTQPDGASGERRYAGLDAAALRSALLEDLAAAGAPAALQALAAATHPRDLRFGRQAGVPPLPAFTRGRLGLLGDAAHAMPPTLGQGANTALEDAAQLGLCARAALQAAANGADGNNGMPTAVAALAAYDVTRRERCWAIQQRAKIKLIPGAGGGWAGMSEADWAHWLYTFDPAVF